MIENIRSTLARWLESLARVIRGGGGGGPIEPL